MGNDLIQNGKLHNKNNKDKDILTFETNHNEINIKTNYDINIKTNKPHSEDINNFALSKNLKKDLIILKEANKDKKASFDEVKETEFANKLNESNNSSDKKLDEYTKKNCKSNKQIL